MQNTLLLQSKKLHFSATRDSHHQALIFRNTVYIPETCEPTRNRHEAWWWFFFILFFTMISIPLLWSTNAQLFHKLSHSHMFRHYRVILRKPVINTLPSKGKAVPLQAWGGAEGSRKLRFPDFLKTAQDDGKVVSITHRPHLPPKYTLGTHFC
jgi:hypothetical protein